MRERQMKRDRQKKKTSARSTNRTGFASVRGRNVEETGVTGGGNAAVPRSAVGEGLSYCF
jgi:hypothetical protein